MKNIIISSAAGSANAPGWKLDGRRRFVLLCSYYVLVTYLMPSVGGIRPYSFSYFALILPGWLYIALSWRVLMRPCGTVARLWWLFVAASLVAAAFQGNPSLAYNSLYLGLLAIVIINSGGYLRTKELNILFFLTLVGSVTIYLLGITEYGFFPGQAAAPSCHTGLSFRVSLFGVPSESASLSLFVLLWNIFLPPGGGRWIRWVFIALSLYFLVLSGIRSAMLALMLISPVLLYRLLPGRSGLARGAIACMICVGLAGFSFHELMQPSGSSRFGDFLANYVLRTGTCAAFISAQEEATGVNFAGVAKGGKDAVQEVGGIVGHTIENHGLSSAWLEQTFNRHCSAKFQWKLFLEHPLVGNSVVHPRPGALPAEIGCSVATMARYCEACVMTTYWLSKGGLAGVLVVGIYLTTLWLTLRRRSAFGFATLAAFGLIMQGWGVMFTPYNFNFYMLVSLIPLIGINGLVASPAVIMKGKP